LIALLVLDRARRAGTAARVPPVEVLRPDKVGELRWVWGQKLGQKTDRARADLM
jgi:hypothetical protein